jgi:hypothetical protein
MARRGTGAAVPYAMMNVSSKLFLVSALAASGCDGTVTALNDADLDDDAATPSRDGGALADDDGGAADEDGGRRIGPNPDGIPGVRPAPAWVASLPAGEWEAISLNTIVDVDSAVDHGYEPHAAPWSSTEGLPGIIDDWNGGALASNYGEAGALLVFGGGHGGYGGSDVYGFDLAERRWKRLSDPCPEIYDLDDETPGTFRDGSPIPPHTNDLAEYQPTTNSFVLLNAYISIPNPRTVNVVHLLTLDHLTADRYEPSMWRRSAINTSRETYGGGALEGGTSCYDRNRDAFWIWEPPAGWDDEAASYYNRFTRYDPNVRSEGLTGEFTNYPGDGSGFSSQNAADCDPTKDLFVFTQFRSGENDAVWYRDLRSPERLGRQLEVTNDGPAVGQAHGWEYSDRRDAFLFWIEGDDVWELRIEDDADRNYTRGTWERISIPGGVSPNRNPNGTFSRFRIARFDLDGELVEVAVVVSHVETQVFALRVP